MKMFSHLIISYSYALFSCVTELANSYVIATYSELNSYLIAT